MLRLISAACGLAFLGAPAMAQPDIPGAPAPGGTIILAQHESNGGSWRDERDWRGDRGRMGHRDWHGNKGWRNGDSDRADNSDEDEGPQHMADQPPPPPPHGPGLQLHMRRGDAAIDLQCPPARDYSSCISAVTQLMDKLDERHAAKGANRDEDDSGEKSGTGTTQAPASRAPTMPTPETPSTR